VVFGSDRPTEALATLPRRRNSDSPVCEVICRTAPVWPQNTAFEALTLYKELPGCFLGVLCISFQDVYSSPADRPRRHRTRSEREL
jgi:hypothetical protein